MLTFLPCGARSASWRGSLRRDRPEPFALHNVAASESPQPLEELQARDDERFPERMAAISSCLALFITETERRA